MKLLPKRLLQGDGVSGRACKTSPLKNATLDYSMEIMSSVIKIALESGNKNWGSPE